jgi:thioredoxin-related protein
MTSIYYFLFYLPLFFPISQNAGIQFEHNLTWMQVLAKAKRENKYVFVDCYATWCGPCRKMDQEVFTSNQLGGIMDSNFISVKVQIDSTKDDSEIIKEWYGVSYHFRTKYNINILPTYLFFSPDGNVVHKDVGETDQDGFLTIIHKALDSSSQYFTILTKYQHGNKVYATMPSLAAIAKSVGDQKMADSIALDYKTHYIDVSPDSMLLNKETLDFITRDFFYPLFYFEGSQGKAFKLFFTQTSAVDSVGGGIGFSSYMLKAIINKEELMDKLYLNDKIINRKPDWNGYRGNIIRKYGATYANELVMGAQIGYYSKSHNWKRYIKNLNQQIADNPPKPGSLFLFTDYPYRVSDAWTLNCSSWNLFLNCSDRNLLTNALKWIDMAIQLEQPNPNVQYFDTKANLLYKAGLTSEAIKCETKAVEMDNEIAQKSGKQQGGMYDIYMGIITKMRAGLPTWTGKIGE